MGSPSAVPGSRFFSFGGLDLGLGLLFLAPPHRCHWPRRGSRRLRGRLHLGTQRPRAAGDPPGPQKGSPGEDVDLERVGRQGHCVRVSAVGFFFFSLDFSSFFSFSFCIFFLRPFSLSHFFLLLLLLLLLSLSLSLSFSSHYTNTKNQMQLRAYRRHHPGGRHHLGPQQRGADGPGRALGARLDEAEEPQAAARRARRAGGLRGPTHAVRDGDVAGVCVGGQRQRTAGAGG